MLRSLITIAVVRPSLRETMGPYSFAHFVNLDQALLASIKISPVHEVSFHTGNVLHFSELDEGFQ